MSFFVGPDWVADWTVWNWSWWFSWAPFAGLFLAALSRGRTVRTVVFTGVVATSAATMVWFLLLGGTSLHLQSSGAADILGAISARGGSVAVSGFPTFAALPLSDLLIFLFLALIVVFITTSADTSTLVVSILATRRDLAPTSASIAFFLVLDAAFPTWVTLVVVVLAVLLVMSSADTMFNAIASVVTADLARLLDEPSQRTLWAGGRGLTVAVAAGAILIGSQGYSVLELFLTADLLAAAIFVPFIAGLYSERLSGTGAILSSVAGLVVGVAYFPLLRAPLADVPGLDVLLPTPGFLPAFVGATVVAVLGTILTIAVWDGNVDLETLDRDIRLLDETANESQRDGSLPTEGSR
jgi:hypothetical protein